MKHQRSYWVAGVKYRWSDKHHRAVPVRSLVPSWFRDDPLTATLAYLAVLGMIVLGVLVICAVITLQPG